MDIRSLVNAKASKQVMITPPTQKGEVQPASATTTTVETKTPTFLTPQTLVTFPGATLAIAAVDKLLHRLVPSLGGHDWPIAVIGILVGIFITWVSVTDPDVILPRQKIILVVVGIFNTVFLIASALGIQILASGPPSPGGGGSSGTTGTTGS
jgi:hypothetical protein